MIGDKINIYLDPLTEKHLEGIGTIIETVKKDFHFIYYVVCFPPNHYSYFRKVKRKNI